MNKTAIKNFAVWARNKLIADIRYRAGLMGITEKGIASPLPQSTGTTEFYDIGTAEPYAISGQQVEQRRLLAVAIRKKERDSDYPTAYHYILEEVAYTWFNRLIAVRFMEVNDYLPSHIRVLSSETGKLEPDLVTTPFDADLSFTPQEEAALIQMKQNNQLDEAFRLLFIKQCNALNAILPDLFEVTGHYTELLLNLSVVDQDGVVWHLVHDIDEADFDVTRGGQVEIIGWLYQYYNTEPKDETFALLKKNVKITKERIPSATQLFTPDWIVRYMVENSLGRLWLEGHPNDSLKAGWKYYLDEAEQEPDVQAQLEELRRDYRTLNLEDIRVIDPCMGSGHILVYAFDVLMQIYESQGYTQRDAAQSILKNNLYGLDIDQRAAQLAYFAVMMKARQYDRRIFSRDIHPHIYAIPESNDLLPDAVTYFQNGDPTLTAALNSIIEDMHDAAEYGSILQPRPVDFPALYTRFDEIYDDFGNFYRQNCLDELLPLVRVAQVLAEKYQVVVTNPPYMGSSNMGPMLADFTKKNYPDSKSDMSTVFMERTMVMCAANGYMAMINIPVWMFLSSYEKLRINLFRDNTLVNMVHPGRGIFGSDFGTTTFVFKHGLVDGYKGNYHRLYGKQGEVKSPEEREQALLAGKGCYTAQQSNFSKIPGSPVAYSMSEKLITLFDGKRVGDYCTQKMRICTGDNSRFLRFWHELNTSNLFYPNRWVAFSKGGAYRKWYGNWEYVLDYSNNGFDLKHSEGFSGGSDEYYFKPGLVWTDLSSGKISFRDFPAGAIACSAGPMIYADSEEVRYYLAGFLNSTVANEYVKILCVTIHFQWGDIAKFPLLYDKSQETAIVSLVKDAICIAHDDWDAFETSWDFKRHPLV